MIKKTHSARGWSTDLVPQAQRFDYWSNILSTTLTPMTVISDDVRHFDASLTEAAMGSLSVIEQRGSAHESLRRAKDVDQSQSHTFHLLMSVRSEWDLEHRQRMRLRPGELVLTNSNYGHHIQIRERYHFVHLKLPPSWLEAWLPEPDVLVGRPLSSQSDPGRALASFVTDLRPEFVGLNVQNGGAASDHIGALLAMLADELPDDGLAVRSLAQRVLDSMRQRCRESELTACEVGRTLGLAEFEVHRALLHERTTFGAALGKMRVGLMRGKLTHPKE